MAKYCVSLWEIWLENIIKFEGKKIPISPLVPFLYPTVYMDNVSLEANFGDNPAKAFKYDIEKCPGLDSK
jgi:hypothetical protein